MEKLRILIADGHSLFRQAVKAALEIERDFEVTAEAKDGIRAIDQAVRVRPDVALLDVELPRLGGIQATQAIKERLPECRVLLLAGEQDDDLLLEAVEAGIDGYLTKECPLSELMEATRGVARGATLIPSVMLGPLLKTLVRRRKEQGHALRKIAVLTEREKEILALLAEGLNNEMIAEKLVISPQTARTHVQNILRKLDMHSRLEAAAFVIQRHLLEHLDGRAAEDLSGTQATRTRHISSA